ncbi:sensor histidine kinase [Streptomyces niveiscabiei]|uniref:histidine kinase n=1 Tax=Streptomyces niveiscabiei TaxID=164115 RepID=A0ABW9HTN2_9ACTN
MSHLRAPAARADRREGGRHGRPVARTAETHIRPHLLRLAVLPPTAVALGACAVVLFTVRATGVRLGPTLWAVLAGAVVVTGVGIGVAAVAAGRTARSVTDRLDALRRSAARGEADLRALVEALRRGEAPPQRRTRGLPPGDADEFELLAADLARAHDGAVAAVVQATQLSSRTGSEQKLEVFLNLARRLQSLVHREILLLDELENEIEDPDLLKGLFHVDHLATRVRRHAENLAVLGGAVSRRQWSHPVSMTEVLRSAIAEVEQYSRVKLVPPVDGDLRGHAVADVIHLLAELVENATVFSAPHTQVLLRANLVTSGLAVEVEDRGLGMPPEEQARMNALLADPDQVNVGRLLADGRIGLFVVSQLARRHGIRVRLQNNIYGGVQAILVVPQALLGDAGRVPPATTTAGPRPTDGTAVPVTASPATPPHGTPGPRHASPRTTPSTDGAQPPAGAHRVNGTRAGGHSADASPQATGTRPTGSGSGGGHGRGTPRGGGAGSGGAGAGYGVGGQATGGVPRVDVGRAGGAGAEGYGVGGASTGGVPRVDAGRSGGGGAEGGYGAADPATGGVPRVDAARAGGPGVEGGYGPGGPAAAGAARVGGSRAGGSGAEGAQSFGGTSFGGQTSGGTRRFDGVASGGSGGEGGSRPPGPALNGSPSGPAPAFNGTPPGPAASDGAHPTSPAPGNGVRPAPLPMRNTREARPNPAEARPGIRVEDRAAVEEVQGEVPVPRVGAVRGTMGKPRLPRRRAQEHLAPQLRGGPVQRPESEEPGGHDPGLMAAFQRGMGLAEAQLGMEMDQSDQVPTPDTPLTSLTHHPDGTTPAG